MTFQQRERLWEINPSAPNEEKKDSKQKKKGSDSPHLEDTHLDTHLELFPIPFLSFSSQLFHLCFFCFPEVGYIDGVKGLGASGPCTCTILYVSV